MGLLLAAALSLRGILSHCCGTLSLLSGLGLIVPIVRPVPRGSLRPLPLRSPQVLQLLPLRLLQYSLQLVYVFLRLLEHVHVLSLDLSSGSVCLSPHGFNLGVDLPLQLLFCHLVVVLESLDILTWLSRIFVSLSTAQPGGHCMSLLLSVLWEFCPVSCSL